MIKKLMILGVCLFSITRATAEVPFIELTTHNLVSLRGGVDAQSVSNVILGLERSKAETTYLYINSPGGSIIDGISLVTYLQHTKKSIVCIANYAASMAHAILEACPKRLGVPTNVLLQHRAQTNAGGNVQELQATVDVLKGLEDYLNEMEAKRIGIPLKVFQQKVNPVWITFGKESLDTNLIDGIVEIGCSSELYKTKAITMVPGLFGPVKIVLNGCPLIPAAEEQEATPEG